MADSDAAARADQERVEELHGDPAVVAGQQLAGRSSDRQPGPKRVSSAELFFDLVFAFAVTQISVLLEHDHSWAGLLRALIVFVPVYWLWVGTAIQTNLLDISRTGLRLSILGIALTALFMALAVPLAFGPSGLLFAVAYWVGRGLLGGRVVVSAWRTGRWPLNPYTVSIAVTGPLLVSGALARRDIHEVVWGCAALLDLSSPTLLRGRLSRIRYDPDHLAERFGLFLLIALGESVVEVGAAAGSQAQSVGLAAGVAVVGAFALSAGLWWVYFQFAADAMRHSLATAQVQLDITRMVLSFGHLSFVAGIIVVAVGMREAVTTPSATLGWGVAGLLFGGTAVYLATFGLTRWSMFHLVSRTRLSAAAVVLLALPVASAVPAVGALLALAVIVALLNAYELYSNRDAGWRARLRSRTVAGARAGRARSPAPRPTTTVDPVADEGSSKMD